MKSFIATATAILALAMLAGPALAMPADNGPKTVAQAPRTESTPVAPDDGTATIVYVLIGVGAALSLGAGGFLGARAVTQHHARPHTS
jgi:hypothetical protein